MSAKIKKGDNVIVLSGKDKGKTGRILKVIKGKDKPTCLLNQKRRGTYIIWPEALNWACSGPNFIPPAYAIFW